MDFIILVSLALMIGSFGILFIRPLGAARAPLMNFVLFIGTSLLLWFGASPFLAWAADFFAIPIFIFQHWGELSGHTKQVLLLLVLGFTVSMTSIIGHFRLFVYRSVFPDFYREDDHGHRIRFGRAYYSKKLETGEHLTYWRYHGERAAPWKFNTITSAEPPRQVSAFVWAIPAARFDRVGERQWVSIGLRDKRATMPTTRLDASAFRAWEVEDLERKKEIARDGAQGHLLTQRQKSLNNRMDTTILRSGRLLAHRGKERFTKRHPPVKSDVERLTVMVREGAAGLDEDNAPGSVDDGGPTV